MIDSVIAAPLPADWRRREERILAAFEGLITQVGMRVPDLVSHNGASRNDVKRLNVGLPLPRCVTNTAFDTLSERIVALRASRNERLLRFKRLTTWMLDRGGASRSEGVVQSGNGRARAS